MVRLSSGKRGEIQTKHFFPKTKILKSRKKRAEISESIKKERRGMLLLQAHGGNESSNLGQKRSPACYPGGGLPDAGGGSRSGINLELISVCESRSGFLGVDARQCATAKRLRGEGSKKKNENMKRGLGHRIMSMKKEYGRKGQMVPCRRTKG